MPKDVTRCRIHSHTPTGSLSSRACRLGVLLLLLTAPVVVEVRAQAGAPAPREEVLHPPRAEEELDPLDQGWIDRFLTRVRMQDSEDRPLLEVVHISPVFGGLHPGAGTTAGLKFEPLPQGSPLYLASSARFSLRRYWALEALAGYDDAPYVVYGYARYRHLPEEDFYGLGPNTPVDRHATYRQDEILIGALAGLQTPSGLFAGAHLSFLENRIGPGQQRSLPQVYEEFEPHEAPGHFPGVSYVLAGAWLEYDSRNLPLLRAYGSRFAPGERRLHGLSLDAERGINVSAEARHYMDLDGGDFGFSRLILEAQQYLPLFDWRHVLAVRQYGSFSRPSEGETIPFYMMQALGGQRSLRGFGTYRFRDFNVMLLNAEYRYQLLSFLQLAVFADAGHVFRRFDAVNKDDFEASHGAGVRLQFGGRTFVRFDVTRSREGIGTHVSVGSFL